MKLDNGTFALVMKHCCLVAILLFAACSKPKPTTPSLTPQTAAELLHYNNRAQNWIKYVKRQNATCDYKLDLPDQTTHPTQLDLSHIVSCGGRPAPLQFDASVSFTFDKNAQRWTITRFAS